MIADLMLQFNAVLFAQIFCCIMKICRVEYSIYGLWQGSVCKIV